RTHPRRPVAPSGGPRPDRRARRLPLPRHTPPGGARRRTRHAARRHPGSPGPRPGRRRRLAPRHRAGRQGRPHRRGQPAHRRHTRAGRRLPALRPQPAHHAVGRAGHRRHDRGARRGRRRRRHRHDPEQRHLRPRPRTLPGPGRPPRRLRPDRQRRRPRLPLPRRHRPERRALPVLPVQRRVHDDVPLPDRPPGPRTPRRGRPVNTDASRNPGAGAGTSPGKDPLPGDLVMARALWPVLLASAVGLLPFTVFSTYLVPIADRAGSGVAAVGGLRGLGGLAALLVGTALAPFLDRVRRDRAAAGALVVLGASAALGASGDFVPLAAFCLLVGASTAVLNPALTAAAADRYGDGPAAGRAATLVAATQSMTAMLAAPAVALPALLWGWQGDLLAVAAACLVLAAVVLT